MNTKLTLTVDKEVIEKAKTFAKKEGRSLSNLIEDYLKSLIERPISKSNFEYTPIVNSLRGAIQIEDKETFDYKDILEDELIKKYLN